MHQHSFDNKGIIVTANSTASLRNKEAIRSENVYHMIKSLVSLCPPRIFNNNKILWNFKYPTADNTDRPCKQWHEGCPLLLGWNWRQCACDNDKSFVGLLLWQWGKPNMNELLSCPASASHVNTNRKNIPARRDVLARRDILSKQDHVNRP